jgi:hypothetical protein
MAVAVSSLTNVPMFIVALSFGTSALLLVLHKLVWPLLERPLYQLARIGVFRGRATRGALFSLGAGAMLVGLGKGGDVVRLARILFWSA